MAVGVMNMLVLTLSLMSLPLKVVLTIGSCSSFGDAHVFLAESCFILHPSASGFRTGIRAAGF